MQRRNLALIAVCGLCAATALWLGSGDDGPPGGVAPTVAPEPEPGPGTGGTVGSANDPPLPDDAPRVVVRIAALQTWLPPLPPMAWARLAPNEPAVPALAVAGVGADPFAGLGDGGAGASGLALVRVPLPAGNSLLRVVAVEAGAAAELPIRSPVVVRSTVTDRLGAPLAGATVWLGECAADGTEVTATAAADGTFELAVAGGLGVPLVVSAPGHVASWRTVEVGAAPLPLQLPLLPGGVLEVQLTGLAAQLAGARVHVVPAATVGSELSTFPFFRLALADGVPVDEQGRATIPGLPQQGAIGVVVRHPGAALAAAQIVQLAGERTRALLPFRSEPVRAVAVSDPDGQPVAGVWARLGTVAGRGRGSSRFVAPGLEALGSFTAAGAADGTVLVPVGPGSGSWSLRAPGHAGADLQLDAGGIPERVVLPRWLGGEPAVVLRPPVAGQRWRSEWNLSGGLACGHRPDESPTIALPHAGRFRIELQTWRGSELVAERVLPAVDATGPVPLEAPPLPR